MVNVRYVIIKYALICKDFFFFFFLNKNAYVIISWAISSDNKMLNKNIPYRSEQFQNKWRNRDKIDILNKIKQNMFDRYLKMKNYEVLKQKVSQLTKICMSCSACSLMETDL